MRILLTGASGMVGSHMLKHLLKKTDAHIICVCSWEHKGEPGKVIWALTGEQTNQVEPDYSKRVTVITHDISAPFTERVKRKIGTVDIILNIASESHVDRSIEEPVDFVLNNVKLALNMLELAREVKPKLFLQFSTDESFGVAPEGTSHHEWSPHIPSNPYSASKAAQEDIAISYWRTYGVPVIITNTMNVFSENQDWEKFIPLCVKKILSGEEITIHAYPGATKAGSRFYIHADSVAEAVLFLINQAEAKRGVAYYPNSVLPDRFNIVGDRETDNLTLALTIGEILNKEVKYRLTDFHSSRPGHDARYALDGSKLAKEGWKPSANFNEKLKEVVLNLKNKLN